MSDAKIVKLAETEVVSFGPLAHYQPIIGDDEGTTPVRTGIQTAQPGYVAPVHSHPYLEILHILDGTAEAWLEGREDEKVVLSKGDTIALPPGAPHSFRVVGDEPLRLLGTHVSPTRIVDYQDGGPTDGHGYRSSKGASTAPSEPPPETGCAGEAGARTAVTPTRSWRIRPSASQAAG